MKVEGTYTFDADIENVWRAMMSPEVLSGCIPGCERFEFVEDGTYEFDMKVGVAAISSAYKGKLILQDVKDGESYRMVVEGAGMAGSVRGDGMLVFSDVDGATQIDFSGDAQVSGLVARLGQRLMSGASRMMINQFFECMKLKIEVQ